MCEPHIQTCYHYHGILVLDHLQYVSLNMFGALYSLEAVHDMCLPVPSHASELSAAL